MKEIKVLILPILFSIFTCLGLVLIIEGSIGEVLVSVLIKNGHPERSIAMDYESHTIFMWGGLILVVLYLVIVIKNFYQEKLSRK